MYDITVRRHALALLEQGLTISDVSRRTGVSRGALREWLLRTEQGRELYVHPHRVCPRCTALPRPPEPEDSYAYLLGLYLGDGYISPVGDRTKMIWALRIACADAWPGLIEECVKAVSAIRPGNKVRTIQGMFTGALDRLGVAWAQMNATNISVAKREAVARLDAFVGPKF
ncbi:helix-turn-helix domain-containing protein [Actinomadura luteofluorescens]|uniref:helix-turn-helix domain-containing protein n=1 Tax=Actinomadura luteofluorescens TaxID=46163 RepID=UPI0030D1A74F